jgi:hypothetical protein
VPLSKQTKEVHVENGRVAKSGITNDYYPVPGMNHFEYLLPGVMGYAVIYMGMMVAPIQLFKKIGYR